MTKVKEIEFVVTVPEEVATEICMRTEARQTSAVLIDIFLAAKKYVVLSAPFLQNFNVVNPNLKTAIKAASERDVKITIISTGKSLAHFNSASIGRNVRVFQPVDNFENDNILASHAKFCLADGELVYIGSANITELGQGKHIEMGVLGRKELARKVEKFWEYLSRNGFLIERT